MGIKSRLNIGDPKPTIMPLQIVDRSINCSIGVLEYISVMIDQYYVSVNFVILDIEEYTKLPIILGRPFLATTRVIIDFKMGKLVLEILEHNVEFDIFKIAKHQPSYVDECNFLDAIRDYVEEVCEVQEDSYEEIFANMLMEELEDHVQGLDDQLQALSKEEGPPMES